MSTSSIPGFISKPSRHSVPETIQRVCALLKSKGVAIFALIESQWRSRESWPKDATHTVVDFWQSERG